MIPFKEAEPAEDVDEEPDSQNDTEAWLAWLGRQKPAYSEVPAASAMSVEFLERSRAALGLPSAVLELRGLIKRGG